MMKTILVTGAGSGIGKAITLALANAGHTVYACDKENNFEVFENNPTIIPCQLDVTNQEEVNSVVSKVTSKGSLDVLINGAGVTLLGPLLELPLDRIKQLFDVNVFGYMDLAQACFELLKKSKGLIINISSIEGLSHFFSFNGSYSMSKFSVEAFSHVLRTELHKFGIKICDVNPGTYATAIYYKVVDNIKHFASESRYYKEEFSTANENYDPSQIGRDPAIIGQEILKIVESDNPPEAYISGTEEEKDFVYQAIITRLMQLVQSSNKDLDAKKFILNSIEKIPLQSKSD